MHNSITCHLYIVLCIVCSSPHVNSASIVPYTLFHLFSLPSPCSPSTQSPQCCPMSMSPFLIFFFFAQSLYHPHPVPTSGTAVSLLPTYESVTILIVGPFCSLDSMYE